MRTLTILAAALASCIAFPAYATSCAEHAASTHSASTLPERSRAMAQEIEAYQALAEEALGMRAEAIRFYQELQIKSAAGKPLSGADLKFLNEGAAALLSQRAALMQVAEAHECWVTQAPSDNPGEAAIQISGVAMSISAALILYDNYLSAIAPYRNDHELRQHLNRKDSGFDLQAGTLNKIAESFASPANRQRIRRAVLWYEQYGKTATPTMAGYPYLNQLIAQSPSLNMVRKTQPLLGLGGQIDILSAFTVDTLFGLKNETTNLSSLLFGNSIGLVETRRGKLHQRSEIASQVASNLQAGDILVEKTPFRLTDTFIPGHWGHAAIWVGNEAELRDLGIWDHPVTRPHQESIRAGKGIVEALRSGVEMNNVEHFLNIDDLGVLRHETLSKEKRSEVILQALRQVGKPYDFNFDAETTHRVFCSKLVYLAYGDLQWPTSRMMGKTTVTPDNIASRALGDGPLSVSLLFHDGKEVTEGKREFMEALMKPQKVANVVLQKSENN